MVFKRRVSGHEIYRRLAKSKRRVYLNFFRNKINGESGFSRQDDSHWEVHRGDVGLLCTPIKRRVIIQEQDVQETAFTACTPHMTWTPSTRFKVQGCFVDPQQMGHGISNPFLAMVGVACGCNTYSTFGFGSPVHHPSFSIDLTVEEPTRINDHLGVHRFNYYRAYQ